MIGCWLKVNGRTRIGRDRKLCRIAAPARFCLSVSKSFCLVCSELLLCCWQILSHYFRENSLTWGWRTKTIARSKQWHAMEPINLINSVTSYTHSVRYKQVQLIMNLSWNSILIMRCIFYWTVFLYWVFKMLCCNFSNSDSVWLPFSRGCFKYIITLFFRFSDKHPSPCYAFFPVF